MKPLLLFLSAALHAQQPLGHPDNPVAGKLEAIEAGKKTYLGSCSGCHGSTGEGGRGPNLRDGRLIRRSTDYQVFTTIKKGVAGSDMPGSNLPDDQVWALVAYVRSLGAPASDTPVPGDSAKGEAVYRGSNCSMCHMINGRGGAMGPDLSAIGATRSYGVLRESLLNPAERITAGYQPVAVKTKDGRTLYGVVKNYTNYNLQMTDKSGQLYLFDTNDLLDVQLSMKSLMPGDYAGKLSKDQVTDLLAYLSSLSLRQADPAVRRERLKGQQR